MNNNNIQRVMRLVFFVMFVLICGSAFGQSKIVRGTVTDVSDNSSIPGATVVEVDKDNRILNGTITDFNGNYALSMKDGNNRISFGFIGFKTLVMEAKGKVKIDVKLTSEVTMLGDIKIVAEKRGGDGISTIAVRDMAVPMATMSMKEVEGIQANSVDEALQGRLTGVDISANGGDPGSGMSIRIRGTSTLNANSKPLIVVDGVPYNTEIASDFDFGSEDEEGYGDLLNIAPEDIAEIAVLKDASATAMWGTQAANGVLLIKTKRGAKRKPQVSYTHKSTFSYKVPALPTLNGDQYSTMILEGYLNRNGYPLNTASNKEFLYDPTDPYYYYNYSNNTNWYDELYRNSYQHTHNLTVNGGGEKVAYNLSVNYKDQKGNLAGTGFKNLSTRLNLDYNVSEKIKVRTDFTFTSGRTDKVNDPKYFGGKMYNKMPNMAVYEYDEYGNQTPVYFSPEYNIQGGYSSTYNPVAMANEATYTVGVDELISNFVIDYRILPSLVAKTLVSYKVKNTLEEEFLPQIATGVNMTSIYSNKSDERDKDQYDIYTDSKINYTPFLGEKHQFGSTLQFTTFQAVTTPFNLSSSNSPSPELTAVMNGADYNLDGYADITENKTMGLLLLMHYKYNDKYIFAATARHEGNSRFSKKYRYGTFKSFSASYRISEENFMKRFNFLDELRFSFSWGENGTPPKYEYMFFNRYSSSSSTYLGATGVYPSSMQLDNLRWEVKESLNFNLNLSMFDNRLSFIGDLYNTNTIDKLEEKGYLPSTSGYSMQYTNIGDTESYGWELAFEAVPVRNSNFRWALNFNISRNTTMYRKVNDSFISTKGSTDENGKYLEITQVDNPTGSFYGYRSLGVYPDAESTIAIDRNGNQIFDANGNPVNMVFNYPTTDYEFQAGDARYEDINHDGNINYMDVVYLGNSNPEFYGGFGTSLTIKSRLSMSVFFNYRYGNSIINKTRMLTENMYNYDNQSTSVLRRWRKEGDETDIPRALLYGGYNWLGSDRYVEDGSFIRLKYITLRYQFAKDFAKKMAMKKLSLQTSISNIHTWTKYKGQNPDISTAYDEGRTPLAPSVTFTLSMTF